MITINKIVGLLTSFSFELAKEQKKGYNVIVRFQILKRKEL